MNQLVANLILNTAIFYLAYRWLLLPKMHLFRPASIVLPILLLQAMRHLGLMFITPGVVLPGMPAQFAVPAATGDFIAAVLAITAAFLIQRKSKLALPMTWLFTVVGSLDFALAIVLSRVFFAAPFLGSAYWIPAFWVPMLIVGHWIIFQVLRGALRNNTSLIA